MKVIVYNEETNHVSQVFNDVHDPKLDRERGVITHSNGKIFGLHKNDPNRQYMIVEDHVDIAPGTLMDDSMKDYDQSSKFDGFSFEDLKDYIEEMGEEIKQEIKEIFDDEGDDRK